MKKKKLFDYIEYLNLELARIDARLDKLLGTEHDNAVTFEPGSEPEYLDLCFLEKAKNGTNRVFKAKDLMKAGIEPTFIEIRCDGNLEGKAFWLNSNDYNWELIRDEYGALCLVPTVKK